MKIETDNLVTVKNFAALEKVTTSYIYKLVKAGRMQSVVRQQNNFFGSMS
jgi:hypothetical protein